nr:glycosyltransferase [Rosenbergiella metrosideri]
MFKRKLKIRALKKYDKVVVLTNEDKKNLKGLNVNAIKIVNPIYYKSLVKGKFNKKVIAVGRLESQKNFLELIEIWNTFIKKNPGWSLDIAGEGEQRDIIQDRIENYKLENSVTLLGKVDNIEYFYKRSDFCVMTSHYEGLPLSLLEAKAHSLPCVSYDCPTGPSDIINDGIDGFLIKLGDKTSFVEKMNLLSNDQKLFNKFSENTKFTAKKFEFSAIESLWLKLIH